MNSNIDKKIANRTIEVNEQTGRVLVSVSLLPRVGREPTVRVTAADVRSWLTSEKKLKVGELISGSGVHNNMSRRLGLRTQEDLSTDFVFALIKDEPKKKVEKVAVKKAAPKKTTKAKATVAKTKVEKAEPTAEAEVKAPVAKPKAKATTATRRTTTRTRSTTKSKTGDKK